MEVAGTFSVPFGSPKGTHKGRKPLKRVMRRKVARNESPLQNQSNKSVKIAKIQLTHRTEVGIFSIVSTIESAGVYTYV